MRRKRSDCFFFFLAKKENGAIVSKQSQIKGYFSDGEKNSMFIGGILADAEGETPGAPL